MTEMTIRRNAPTTGIVERDIASLTRIATHPAFRIGFLDAQAGRPIDHFNILRRIQVETPIGALRRLGWWDDLDLLLGPNRLAEAAEAEYRYEEGRLLHLQAGVRCKAWGRPDFLPVGVIRWISERACKKTAR